MLLPNLSMAASDLPISLVHASNPKKLLVPNQLLSLNTWLLLSSNTIALKHVLLPISGVNTQGGPHSL